MELKTIFLAISFVIGFSQIKGQTETIVNFRIDEKVTKSKDFRFYLLPNNDTIKVFRTTGSESKVHKKTQIPIGNNTVLGVFEFTSKTKGWQKIEQPILIDKDLKRIEIDLYFTSNDKNDEFLQDFTVDKFYYAHNLTIQSAFKEELGEQPIFKIISNSDSTFWGVSSSNHFYGEIQFKTEYGWIKFSGSYCSSTAPEKSLIKHDSVYSYIPNYSLGDEYHIKQKGIYKYTVPMSLEKFSEGMKSSLIKDGQTRKSLRSFYELEKEFTIK